MEDDNGGLFSAISQAGEAVLGSSKSVRAEVTEVGSVVADVAGKTRFVYVKIVDSTSPPQKKVCWGYKVRYTGTTGAKRSEAVADFSSASTDAVSGGVVCEFSAIVGAMVSEPHGSDLPELDLSRSENMDAVVTGSGESPVSLLAPLPLASLLVLSRISPITPLTPLMLVQMPSPIFWTLLCCALLQPGRR